MAILLIDDSPAIREILWLMLESEGYTDLYEAGSAAEAFEMLGLYTSDPAPITVDLILTDLGLPEIDGIEVIRRIKADSRFVDTPIIMITAVNDSNMLERAFQVGAMDYLTKPVEQVELLARIRSALRLKAETDMRKQREQQMVEYIHQAALVTNAAAAVEQGSFDGAMLTSVARRDDELGLLARVFQRMAQQIAEREAQLQAEVRELRIQIDEHKKEKDVARIKSSPSFQELRERARQLRNLSDEQIRAFAD